MVFMMIAKFFLYSAKYTDFHFSPGCAPSILNLFINMMLFKVSNAIQSTRYISESNFETRRNLHQ